MMRLFAIFSSILESYRARGWCAEYLSPAHDPEMDSHAANMDRPIDVLFVGGYSRHHQQRAAILEKVATPKDHYNIVFCLDRSRLTRLAETLIGRCAPLGKYRRPSSIREGSHEPVYGREFYAMISKGKFVLNGAIDMAGEDRGNMRCFEALGCGALMISDHGHYPTGFVHGKSMLTYSSAEEAASLTINTLKNWGRAGEIAKNGRGMVTSRCSKTAQWERFLALLE